MEKRLFSALGTAAKHILTALQHAIRAIAITGILVFILTAVVTEAVAAFLTHSFPPSGLTHLAAAALGISFGYGAAMTVALTEILRAIIKSIEVIIEESEKLAVEAVKEVEILARAAGTEASHLGHAALTDAGALGHGIAGVAGSVAGVAGGLASGAVHEVQAVEHGIASHLPGHHNA